MQKKRILYLTFFLLLISHQTAYARFLVEGKVGSFKPFSDVIKNLYGDNLGNYQVEVSYSPFSGCNTNWWSRFFVWGSYNYLYDSGCTDSGFFDDDTNIQFYNFALGLKYLYPLPRRAYIYGAAGAKYIFLRVNDSGEIVDSRRRADGLGQAYSIGFLFHLWKCVVFDLFTDVTLKHFGSSSFSHDEGEETKGLDVSGVSLGLGVGIRF